MFSMPSFLLSLGHSTVRTLHIVLCTLLIEQIHRLKMDLDKNYIKRLTKITTLHKQKI